MSRRPQQQPHARPNPLPPPHASYASSSSGTYQYQPYQQYQESGRGPAPHAYNHQNGYGPNGYGGYPQPPPNAEIQLWEWFTTVDTDRSGNAPCSERLSHSHGPSYARFAGSSYAYPMGFRHLSASAYYRLHLIPFRHSHRSGEISASELQRALLNGDWTSKRPTAIWFQSRVSDTKRSAFDVDTYGPFSRIA